MAEEMCYNSHCDVALIMVPLSITVVFIGLTAGTGRASLWEFLIAKFHSSQSRLNISESKRAVNNYGRFIILFKKTSVIYKFIRVAEWTLSLFIVIDLFKKWLPAADKVAFSSTLLFLYLFTELSEEMLRRLGQEFVVKPALLGTFGTDGLGTEAPPPNFQPGILTPAARALVPRPNPERREVAMQECTGSTSSRSSTTN
jgi:hypothetical protein